MYKNQGGFTLIELMIGLVLGLLIVAAGLSVFISGQRSLTLQTGMGELQENANFGLGLLAHDLRLTNLNTVSSQIVNNKASGAGIIFSKDNLPSSLSSVSTDYFTKQNKDTSATNISSDQLTIQYIPQYSTIVKPTPCTPSSADSACKETATGSGKYLKDITWYIFDGVDCEGNRLEFEQKRVIVQRYFLKQDSYQIPRQPTVYGLYCDSGNYIDSESVIAGMGANAQQIMQRIDAFNIRLGVQLPNRQSMRYATVDQYITLMPASLKDTTQFLNVSSVEVGVLARSTTPLTMESMIDNGKTFNLVGNALTLSADQQKGGKFLREEFSQVVAFRNTLGTSE